MCIPRKINFLQFERYGKRGEQRYRQTFRKDFDWLCFNMNLAADRFQYGMKRMVIAIDPSFVPKAGKKTVHIGRFWSGCASSIIMGMESEKGIEKLKARVPLKEMSSYSTSLSSITGGRSSFTMDFASYELVPGDVQDRLLKDYAATQTEE